MQTEVWKEIEGYGGDYLVSNLGRVKSLKYINEKILKLRFDGDGKYHFVSLSKNCKEKVHLVHRLVLQTFNPTSNKSLECNHKDFNKINNKLENLEWVTPQENSQHTVDHGRSCAGTKNGMAKLTEKEVLEIRNSMEKVSQKELAKKYNVCQQLISMIINRKLWKHL